MSVSLESSDQVREHLVAILSNTAGLTARELAARASHTRDWSVTKSDVNRVLYRHLDIFDFDDARGGAPRWFLFDPPSDGVFVSHAVMAPAIENSLASTAFSTPAPLELYAWQREAIRAWDSAGQRGIVEAVTGAGKTRVGLAAMQPVLARGGKVLVIVPTKELLHQWWKTVRAQWPDVEIAFRGDGYAGDFATADVLVSIVNSVREPLTAVRVGSLLIADECHRYGSADNQRALDPRFNFRLGLSATFERNDTGCATYLTPYFGRVCFHLDYERALRDDVIAHFSIALIGVRFSTADAEAYRIAAATCRKMRQELVDTFGVPDEPFGDFMVAVQRLAKSLIQVHGQREARQYLKAFHERQRLLGETPVKRHALASLTPVIRDAERTIVFTQTIDGAQAAAESLRACGFVTECVHSELDRSARAAALIRFEQGTARVITAPQVLDEGVDVPEADVAIVLAATKTRRQMIQRMGRVLRRKPGGRIARFAIFYVEGTAEDPASGAYEGFLADVLRLADAHATFGSDIPFEAAVAFISQQTADGARRAVAAAHGTALATTSPPADTERNAPPQLSPLQRNWIVGGAIERLRDAATPRTLSEACALRNTIEAGRQEFATALRTRYDALCAAKTENRAKGRAAAEVRALLDLKASIAECVRALTYLDAIIASAESHFCASAPQAAPEREASARRHALF